MTATTATTHEQEARTTADSSSTSMTARLLILLPGSAAVVRRRRIQHRYCRRTCLRHSSITTWSPSSYDPPTVAASSPEHQLRKAPPPPPPPPSSSSSFNFHAASLLRPQRRRRQRQRRHEESRRRHPVFLTCFLLASLVVGFAGRYPCYYYCHGWTESPTPDRMTRLTRTPDTRMTYLARHMTALSVAARRDMGRDEPHHQVDDDDDDDDDNDWIMKEDGEPFRIPNRSFGGSGYSLCTTTTRRGVVGTMILAMAAGVVGKGGGAEDTFETWAAELPVPELVPRQQSSVGTAVRQSVVKGAQFMDRVDAQWEAFSDRYHLGSERQKRPGRPAPKIIPPLRPLDPRLAQQLLTAGDLAFLQAFPRQQRLSASELAQQVRIVANTVAPSFSRSLQLASDELVDAVINNDDDASILWSGDVLNFAAYCHYKAYSDLWISYVDSSPGRDSSSPSAKADYGAFKRQFESDVGSRIVSLLLPPATPSAPAGGAATVCKPSSSKTRLLRGRMANIFDVMVDKGLVASIDVSDPSSEENTDSSISRDDPPSISDCNDANDDLLSTFSVALDGDVTLASQLLLQEQGIRLYPNYARFALQALLQNEMHGIESTRSSTTTSVSVMDYYMDTDYNSDPSKFQVKEVLMNVEIDRS